MYRDEFVQQRAQALEEQGRNSLVDKWEDGIASSLFGERAEMVR